MRRHCEAHQSNQTWMVLSGQKTTCNDQCIASLTQVLRMLLQRINARFSSMDITPLELLRMYVLFSDWINPQFSSIPARYDAHQSKVSRVITHKCYHICIHIF
jgi:hypothetical protein